MQLVSFVIRFGGKFSAMVKSFEMRLRLMFNLATAERQVSSGCAVMNSFTRIASSVIFWGGDGSRFRVFGRGMSIEASNLP